MSSVLHHLCFVSSARFAREARDWVCLVGRLLQFDLLEFSLVQISVVVFVVLTKLFHCEVRYDRGEFYRAYLAILIVVYVCKALSVRLSPASDGDGFLGVRTGVGVGTVFSVSLFPGIAESLAM